MHGFSGIKDAEELPDAVSVLVPSTSLAWEAVSGTSAEAASSKALAAIAGGRASHSTPGPHDAWRRRRIETPVKTPPESPIMDR